MAKRTSAIDSDSVVSRKRTADLLRQLRSAREEVRALKQQVAELESRDEAANLARRVTERRRAS